MRDADALIRRLACDARNPDPVTRADIRTSMADARTALCIAKGVALDEIDPASGSSLSRHAYEASRHSYRWYAGHHGLTEYTRPWYEAAVAYWIERRPDLAVGDDWLAGVAKPEDDNLREV